jgi:hypothetical protein
VLPSELLKLGAKLGEKVDEKLVFLDPKLEMTEMLGVKYGLSESMTKRLPG